ncbi:MAG: hypothetical protein J7500_13600 [Sphingomonas sp.]|uniref:hypothetical protein n=1 Tax=Sphingomonas sp. TaxID=28214 RepID=UPI001B121417|nr:hypothetical protein [Sphingomonas sp.]MBO9623736.1 hypothetical protein [Sphingomonas sp.]
MTVNFSNGLTGLSLLTGTNAFTAFPEVTFESKAVRVAKAQFTLEPTTPPWKEAQPSTTLSAQVSAIKALRTIVDKAATGPDALPDDVQTAFTTYKALERLRVLAESASSTTSSDAQRKSMQAIFAKGIADLQSYLASAPSDVVNISFGQTARSIKTATVSAPDAYETQGKGVVKARTDAVPGLTGTEKFSVSLNRPGSSDVVTVDLAAGPQPPTLDSVAAALNAAITAIPARNADGTTQLDSSGNPLPKWHASFAVEKNGDKWGLSLKTPIGTERVSLDQIGAPDALVVATGQTPLDAPTATKVFRLDNPAGTATSTAMTTISALDRLATERAELSGDSTKVTTVVTGPDGKDKTETTETYDVHANTSAAAVVTDPQGNSYVVGTTAGDIGNAHSDGDDNLFLTKLDGEGRIVWQRSLGASGSSSGAAVSLAPDGSIVVAGTVNGSFNGATSDGDMLVAKFNTSGDEQFSTLVRAAGSDTAKAVAVGADGSIFVGGRAASGGGDAFVARIDATGHLSERRTIAGTGSESVNALAIGSDGNLLALVSSNGVSTLRKLDADALATDLGSFDIGAADARAIAVAADGTIAVGGATSMALGGTHVNSTAGGREGFVMQLDASLSGAKVTYLATDQDDQVDSLAFMNGELYAGGRTTGNLGGTRSGPTDGFVARLAMGTGTVASVNQFGGALQRTEPVRIAGAAGGATSLSALGLGRGTLNSEASQKLTTQTGLRPGDSFYLRVNDGPQRKITIGADDTLQTLADRIRVITGSKANITTPKSGDTRSLRIDPKEGNSIELLSGSGDTDALAKLGVEPQRIMVPAKIDASAPSVRPGGTFSLKLTDALNLSTKDNAKLALKQLEDAISMSQTAYRSLYWDDAKAAMADGPKASGKNGGSTAREQAMLKNYQAALTRLSAGPSTTYGF